MLNYGWQYNRDLWNDLSEDLTHSQSWRAVALSEHEAVAVPDRVSGIYCMCAPPPTIKPLNKHIKNNLFALLYTPLYIGKTDNLRRRFRDHCRQPSERVTAVRLCFGSRLMFWFHPLPSERISIEEARLIQCFGPIANLQEGTIKARLSLAQSIGIPH